MIRLAILLYTVNSSVGNFLHKRLLLYILENQEKLCILTAELLEYCNAPKSRPPYRPRIGDACCAKYTSKVVLGKILEERYLVCFLLHDTM